ncbi:hypothetical protein ACYTPF_12565 [Alteromonas sp. HB246098]
MSVSKKKSAKEKCRPKVSSERLRHQAWIATSFLLHFEQGSNKLSLK